MVVLDDLSTGTEANLAWRGNGDELELVVGDVGDAALVRKAMEGCDWVFHKAAVASVPRSVNDPVGTNRINLDATLTCLVAAREAGVKRFVFASSSAIYGDDAAEFKTEELTPAPLSPYALQKYAGESYAGLFHRLYGLTTVSLRYFNVYGPRQSHDSPYSGVIAKFATEMMSGRAPTILGDGLQSRDFVYVRNVVDANMLAAEGPAAVVGGRVYNVGCGASVNLLQLVDGINRLTGQRIEAKFAPARAGDVRMSKSSIERAARELGYEPGVWWMEGLALTLEFYGNGTRARVA